MITVPAVARVFAVTIVARVVIVGHGRGRPVVVLAVVVRRGVILLVHHVPPSLRLPTELDGATRRSAQPHADWSGSTHHAKLHEPLDAGILEDMTVFVKPVALVERASRAVRARNPELSGFIPEDRRQERVPDARTLLRSEQVDREQMELARSLDALQSVGMVRGSGECETNDSLGALRHGDGPGHGIAPEDPRPHVAACLERRRVEEPLRNEAGVCLPPRCDVNSGNRVSIVDRCCTDMRKRRHG